MLKYKSLIVNNDPSSVIMLKESLNKFCPQIDIIGETANIIDSINFIKKIKPQIVFINFKNNNDISYMILKKLTFFNGHIIIINFNGNDEIKFNKYKNVVGNILNPVIDKQLILVVNDATTKIKTDMLQRIKNEFVLYRKSISYIPIQSASKIELINTNEILFGEAKGHQTIFHLINNSSKTSDTNLGDYESLLTNSSFYRIHHKYIVNLELVNKINKRSGCFCELINGKSLPISKRKLEGLYQIIKIKKK